MRHVRILFCLIMKTHCTLRSRGVNTSSEIRRPLRRDSCAFPAEITPRHPTTAAAELIRPPFVLHLSLCANAKSVTGHSRYATRIDSDESIRVSRQCGICACVSARWSVCWWLGCKWIPEVIQCCDSPPPPPPPPGRTTASYILQQRQVCTLALFLARHQLPVSSLTSVCVSNVGTIKRKPEEWARGLPVVHLRYI